MGCRKGKNGRMKERKNVRGGERAEEKRKESKKNRAQLWLPGRRDSVHKNERLSEGERKRFWGGREREGR